ncbi:MAG: ribonuclease H-like YkuK family protein [Saprospiraceae bacterium]
MFINNTKMPNHMSLKERMITEVAKSVEVAYSLCNMLEKYDVELEIHADINTDPNFQSNTALKEAMGYILGMGFVFKAKPDAFAVAIVLIRFVDGRWPLAVGFLKFCSLSWWLRQAQPPGRYSYSFLKNCQWPMAKGQ